jgi:hypothetical protein
VHNRSHVFCTQNRVSTLDILLDRKKPYPLLCRPQAEGGNVSPEYIFSGIIRAGL